MRKFVITKQEAGWRFDKYLKKLLPRAASGFLYKMLRKKNITLNEKKATGNEVVAAGDTVEVFFSEETYRKFSETFSDRERSGRERGGGDEKIPEKMSFTDTCQAYREAYQKLKGIFAVYEDDNILILNKPAGILSQKADKKDISLNEWMIGYLLEKGRMTEEELVLFRPSVCNRLDRNTSGLMLCGKSVRGSQFLSEMLRERGLHKYYVTYVQGRIKEEITLKGYLKKEEKRNRSEIISEKEFKRRKLREPGLEREYKKIETVISPLFYVKERDCTKLEILLVTGRSHQIRAHLAGIGHPVLGDKKYGQALRRQEDYVFRYQLLHAGRVEFPEIKGEFGYLSGVSLTAPEPEDWNILPGAAGSENRNAVPEKYGGR